MPINNPSSAFQDPNIFQQQNVPIISPPDFSAIQNANLGVTAQPNVGLAQLGAGANVNPTTNPFGFLSNVFAGDLAQRQAQQAAQSQAQSKAVIAAQTLKQLGFENKIKSGNLAIKQRKVDAETRKKTKIREAKIKAFSAQAKKLGVDITNVDIASSVDAGFKASDFKKGKSTPVKLFKSTEADPNNPGSIVDVFRDSKGKEQFRSGSRPASKGQTIQVNTGEITKATRNTIEKNRALNRKSLFTLGAIEKTLNNVPDKLFTIPGRLISAGQDLGSKVGFDNRTQKDKSDRIKLQRFQVAGLNLVNDIRKQVTGAQASFIELQTFILPQVIDAQGTFSFDSKLDAKAKLGFLKQFLLSNEKRLAKIEKDGFNIISNQGDSNFIGFNPETKETVDLTERYPLSMFGISEDNNKSQSVTVTIGDRTFSFPNQDAANKFKQSAGIK